MIVLLGNIISVCHEFQVRNAVNIAALAAFFTYVGAGLGDTAGLGDFNLALDDSYKGQIVKGCPAYEEVRQSSMDNFDLEKYQGLWYEHKFHDWTQFKEVYDTTLDIRVRNAMLKRFCYLVLTQSYGMVHMPTFQRYAFMSCHSFTASENYIQQASNQLLSDFPFLNRLGSTKILKRWHHYAIAHDKIITCIKGTTANGGEELEQTQYQRVFSALAEKPTRKRPKTPARPWNVPAAMIRIPLTWNVPAAMIRIPLTIWSRIETKGICFAPTVSSRLRSIKSLVKGIWEWTRLPKSRLLN
jgi:hypothetical protein